MPNNSEMIIVRRKTFLDLCAAAEGSRSWMAHNAPATDWANKVRSELHNALAAAVAEEPLSESQRKSLAELADILGL